MHTILLVSAFAALAAAVPSQQSGLDFAAIADAVPASITGPPATAVTQDVYNSAVASSAAAAEVSSDPLHKRSKRQLGENDPCGPQPDGFGPKVWALNTSDTVAVFLAFKPFADAANLAAAKPPSGYTTSFQNLQASVSANTYLGLNTLQTYDPTLCKTLCDNKPLCTGFNIFFERDPTVNPADSCPNPPSFTNVKCTLWGSPITPQVVTNSGQTRTQFQVVITGSNGYSKSAAPPAVPAYDPPKHCGGAISAPSSESYLGAKFFCQPYDPLTCASACQAQTDYNKKTAKGNSYKPCNYFNSYLIAQDNKPLGVYCALFTKEWAPSFGTNYGQYFEGSQYTISSSYGYALSSQDSGKS